MFEILGKSTEACIGFKASGKAVAADYEMLLPKLDGAIEAHGKINMVVVLRDFDGWGDLDAAKADFKFGKEQYRSVERCAFVSDKKWHKWMVKIMDPFTRRTDEPILNQRRSRMPGTGRVETHSRPPEYYNGFRMERMASIQPIRWSPNPL